MKRFEFRLEKLLRLRGQQTGQARRTLAVAISEEATARSAAASAHERLNARVVNMGQREKDGLTTYEFAALRTHVRYLRRLADEADQALALAAEQSEQRRRELLEVRRKERALEKLRERRHETYQLELLRAEQKELDEFGDRQGLNDGLLKSEI